MGGVSIAIWLGKKQTRWSYNVKCLYRRPFTVDQIDPIS